MMTNLFSVFDPASSFKMPLNWASSIVIMLIVLPMYWSTPTKIFIFFKSILMKLFSEFKTLLGPTSLMGSTLPFISLFLFIVVNNFLGLFPYIFTASSHMTLTLTLSLPLWFSFMLFGWINHTKHMFAHLVPQSTPGALMPFMVLIESISNVIRPLTLAVRLMANMVAGHLLMTLLGNQTAASSGIILSTLILTQIMLLTLESAVAVIQSYVFAVLSTLYASEITSH